MAINIPNLISIILQMIFKSYEFIFQPLQLMTTLWKLCLRCTKIHEETCAIPTNTPSHTGYVGSVWCFVVDHWSLQSSDFVLNFLLLLFSEFCWRFSLSQCSQFLFCRYQNQYTIIPDCISGLTSTVVLIWFLTFKGCYPVWPWRQNDASHLVPLWPQSNHRPIQRKEEAILHLPYNRMYFMGRNLHCNQAERTMKWQKAVES